MVFNKDTNQVLLNSFTILTLHSVEEKMMDRYVKAVILVVLRTKEFSGLVRGGFILL